MHHIVQENGLQTCFDSVCGMNGYRYDTPEATYRNDRNFSCCIYHLISIYRGTPYASGVNTENRMKRLILPDNPAYKSVNQIQ